MIRFFIILLLVIFSINNLMAQNVENLYMRSEETIDKLASDIVNDKGSFSEEQKSAYRQAIKDAFIHYWQNNAVKSGISINDFNKATKNFTKLDTTVFSKLEVLKKQCLLRQDSINVVQDTLSHPEWIVLSHPSNTDTLSIVLHNDTIRIATLSYESSTIDSILNDRRNILNDTLSLCRSMSKQLDGLKDELTNLKSNTSSDAVLLGSLSLTEEMLFDAGNELNKELNLIDVKKLKDAITTFDTNDDVIKSLDQNKHKKLTTEAEKIRPVVGVIIQIKQGIEQMSYKYDKALNSEHRDSIKKEISKKGIDSKWKKIGNEVITALTNQESSFKNIKYLLQFIKENNKETIKNDFNISQTISDIVDFVNPGKDRYNSYYSNFNKILDEVINDFNNNKETVIKQGVSTYIDNKMSKL